VIASRGITYTAAYPSEQKLIRPIITEEPLMKLNRHAFRILPGMRQGLKSEIPLPMRLVANEEFPPLPQTA